jgi:tetratricopeptide (TPR) repeat protein
LARQAKAAPPNDLPPSGAGPTESGAATLPLFTVWRADGSPAPDKLEKGAAPYLVAFHRGCMRANSRQHAAALDFFQRAVDLNPDFAEAHCNLGVAFAKLGRRSRALTEFAIAVSLNSAFFLAAANLWMLLRGDELARRLHDAVGSFEPDYDEPHDNLGRHGKRLLTNEQRAKELKTLARTVPLAKYLSTNERLAKELETLALTQHHIRSGHDAAIVAEVLERFDLWLTPGVIGRISEEEAKHVEAQQTFGFPERPSDYFYEPGHVDWDEVKRFYSEQENPDFVFGAAAAELQRDLSARNVAEINQEFRYDTRYTPESPTPEAAALPQLRMRDASQKIDELAALLPKEQREAFKAKVEAEFAAAAGLTVPTENTPSETTAHANAGGRAEQSLIWPKRAEFYAAADDSFNKGVSLVEFMDAIDKLTAKAQAATTIDCATEEPRPKTIADAKAEALAIGDTTLLGQLVRYEARLKSIELPEPLISLDQAQAAGRLSTTYRDLRTRQIKHGLEPLPKDDRLADAERLSVDFYRKHPEAKLKVKATRSQTRRPKAARTANLS